MGSSKSDTEEPKSPSVLTWMTATLTVYPRFGEPRKIAFPCTWENQQMLQPLEQQQASAPGNKRRVSARPLESRRSSK